MCPWVVGRKQKYLINNNKLSVVVEGKDKEYIARTQYYFNWQLFLHYFKDRNKSMKKESVVHYKII